MYNLNPDRILIIRMSSLGDVILTSLLVRRLRARFPKAYIAMLSHTLYSDILDGFRWLDERFTYPKAGGDKRKLRYSLRHAGFDTIIDLQNNVKSRRLTAFLSPLRVFRFHRSRWNRWQRIHLPVRRAKLNTPLPVALAYIEAVALLGVQDDGKGIEIDVQTTWQNMAQSRLDQYFQGKSHVVGSTQEIVNIPCQSRESGNPEASVVTLSRELDSRFRGNDSAVFQGNKSPLLIAAPGAAHNTKIWLEEKWVELLNAAYTDGYKTQVMVGNSADKSLCERVSERIDHSVLVTAGETGLGELIALIKAADVFITEDSGPMHIAAAVGTPLVAIFGPTVLEFGFAPLRCKHQIVQIEDLKCRPCHPHGPRKCPRGHFRCMENISVDQVLSAIKAMRSGNGSAIIGSGGIYGANLRDKPCNTGKK